jgi:hypothetical protein
MELELTETTAALLGSLIGALSAIVGTIIGTWAQKRSTEEQDAKKYFIDEALDKFISKINYELIAIVAMLKTSEEFITSKLTDLLDRNDILSPVITFSDVNLHRLNELHPVLFQGSIDVIESLVNLKIAVHKLIELSGDSIAPSNHINKLEEKVNQEKKFIEEMILRFSNISADLHKSKFTARKIKKLINRNSFINKVIELETVKKRLLVTSKIGLTASQTETQS